MKSEILKVTGMSGGACVSLVTSALKAVPGVKHVSVSLTPDEATVQFDEGLVSTQQLQDALSRSGYGIAPAKAAGCNGGCGGGCGGGCYGVASAEAAANNSGCCGGCGG